MAIQRKLKIETTTDKYGRKFDLYNRSPGYADDETMTIIEVVIKLLALMIKLGPFHQVRVNTSYDQGQGYMAITDISECDGYVGIDA